jgi:hypothetical protein
MDSGVGVRQHSIFSFVEVAIQVLDRNLASACAPIAWEIFKQTWERVSGFPLCLRSTTVQTPPQWFLCIDCSNVFSTYLSSSDASYRERSALDKPRSVY